MVNSFAPRKIWKKKKMRIQDASCKHFGKIIHLGIRIEKSRIKKMIVRKSFAISSTSKIIHLGLRIEKIVSKK